MSLTILHPAPPTPITAVRASTVVSFPNIVPIFVPSAITPKASGHGPEVPSSFRELRFVIRLSSALKGNGPEGPKSHPPSGAGLSRDREASNPFGIEVPSSFGLCVSLRSYLNDVVAASYLLLMSSETFTSLTMTLRIIDLMASARSM